ncbi:hypothetical protein L6452_09460 [Arctium lappa]|uniref:Uncharacterized protein n=1 Tax=Arctium lappa TaxID=4217 RepID=A0ACB9DL01_ARCLA|nr:hypothetical protein L6452_09460 [Arctium lappa]
MGGVAVLHPQDYVKDHRDDFFSIPVKSRRKPSVNYSTSTPILTKSEGCKRSPPSGVRKNNKTTTMVSDPPTKNLIMGQVKILKRVESLDESSSTVLKDVNDSTSTPPKDVDRDRKISNLISSECMMRNPEAGFSGMESVFSGRKRSPPSGVRKNNKTITMVSDPPAKNLVMGQVKILKRVEALDESSLTVWKDANDSTSTPPKDVVDRDRKVSRELNGGRRVLPAKKKVEKENKKIEGLKVDDFALSSTDRLGPDLEIVPKQM